MSRLRPHLPAGCAIALLSLAGCASRAAAPAAPTASPSAAASAAIAPASIDLPLLERRVAAHMRFLASDALNGRGSGTRDEWIAATYIGAQLAALGLEPMGDDGWFVQQVEVQRFKAGTPAVLTAGDRTFTRGTHFLVGQVPSPRVAGTLQHFAPGTPVTPGAAVILPADAPPASMASLSAAAPVLRKAPAAVQANWEQRATQVPAFISSQLVGTPAAPGAPATLTLDAAAYAAITALADGTPLRLDTDLVPGDRARTWNVVGRLPGSDPSASSEVVILSAHLDHLGVRTGTASGTATTPDTVADVIYNGADDDASGVVAVLELARLLAAGPTPRRPVVFALFGSEESGGYGAGYFVDKPVVPLTDIVADLQVEMIGRPDPKVPAGTLWLTGYERSTLGPQLASRGARLVQDPHLDQNFFERSDNIRFARRGVVAHTVSSFGLHREYHQASDEFRHINITHMRDAIASLVEPVRWLTTTTDKPNWVEGKRP
jgi:aminopeptidase YwaD